MAKAHKLIVGARDWEHAGWCGTFYPGDLPEDWRLSYYANEFAGVLLPESVWRAAEPGEIASWCGDVTEGFLFFLEESGSSTAQQTPVAYRDLFGPHWGGIVSTGAALMRADEVWDLRTLRERFDSLILRSLGEAIPTFFICGDPPDIDHLRKARLLADML